MNTRNSSFELLRIIAIIFIGFLHSMGIAYKGQLSEANNLLGDVINAVCNTGVCCFILISGYYGIRFKAGRFVQLCILTTLYSILVALLNSNGKFDFSFYKALFVIPRYGNWFMACYLITMIFSSFINSFVENWDRLKFANLLLISFACFSVVPICFPRPDSPIMDNYGGGKNLVYFLFVYMTGRYVRMHHDVDYSRVITFGVFLLCSLSIIFLNSMIHQILHRPDNIFAMDNSPFVLLSSLSIFYFFKSLSFSNQIVNWVASSVLTVFLLDGIRAYVDRFINVQAYGTHNMLILYIVLEVLVVFIVALIVDKLRIYLFGKMEDRLISRIVSIINKFWQQIVVVK